MNRIAGTGSMIAPRDGLSHVRGDTDAPLSEQSIPALLADTVARFGERPAVLFREQEPFASITSAVSSGFR